MAWTAIAYLDGDGGDEQDEQDQAEVAQSAATRSEWGDVVERWAVPDAHEEEDEGGPHQPVRRPRHRGERHQAAHREIAHHPVVATEQGVGDAAAVELAHGKQVERGDEEPHPPGEGHGMHEDVHALRDAAEAEIDQKAHEQ